MNSFPLHIVAFKHPWPPVYGGVIDVFYKLKSLSEAGADIRLHSFIYGNDSNTQDDPLPEKYCTQVYRYERRSPLIGLLSNLPYIVSSRASVKLLDNLLLDNAPILFEGLHSCFFLDDEQLNDRFKIVRMHNVEWQYYQHLARVERRFWREWYYRIESGRLKRFEKILKHADLVLPISPAETAHYKKDFAQVRYLPAFHANRELSILPGKGTYALYHGNLSVPENVQAASWLMETVFKGLEIPLIVAGLDPDYKLYELLENCPNVTLIADPETESLQTLIQNAQVHILPTFQSTGIKLKLINTLFNGRWCICNNMMAGGTGLEPYCIISDSAEEMRTSLLSVFEREFDQQQINLRKNLPEQFSNIANAQGLLAGISGMLASRGMQRWPV